MATAVHVREPRTCVTPEVWEREVRLVMRDHDMERELAERTFGQAVAYLATSAERPDVDMGPARLVDFGVHTFVLDTINYTDFCLKHAGQYIHHVPHLPEEKSSQPYVLKATIQGIRDAGFVIDRELWNAKAADCHQCHACCTDSPVS
ncbi:glycine-rich domain-containing protein [Streptomyces sp. NBC_00648]|uniref:glycine-rich domain-containing protein n=1 Tax=Streptomyces sp. NBC_00648 TaxID=2975797 RepID=UPI0032447C87